MTIAVDTNVLARLLLNDHPAQHARARALLEQDELFTAPPTVMLELVWVLEANDCTREEISRALELLMCWPRFQPQDPEPLRLALAWYGQGLDFADALHLALGRGADCFASFDQALARGAARIGAVPPVVGVPALSARQPRPRSARRS
jgi:predicted nucleic acid-binding protein